MTGQPTRRDILRTFGAGLGVALAPQIQAQNGLAVTIDNDGTTHVKGPGFESTYSFKPDGSYKEVSTLTNTKGRTRTNTVDGKITPNATGFDVSTTRMGVVDYDGTSRA